MVYHRIDNGVHIQYFRAFGFLIIGVYHSPNPIAVVVTTGLTRNRVAKKMVKKVDALWENY